MKKRAIILITLILGIASIIAIFLGFNPEFFDIFGIVTFSALFFCGAKVMNSKDKNIHKYGLIIILISSLGLLVDSFIVTKTYLLN